MYNEAIGQAAFLADVHRRQPGLLPAALPGPRRHAAPLRRLSGRLRRLELASPRSAPISPAFGVLVFLFGMFEAFVRKRMAAANPWGEGATTLEWTLPSPPPFHQFEELPRIKDERRGDRGSRSSRAGREPPRHLKISASMRMTSDRHARPSAAHAGGDGRGLCRAAEAARDVAGGLHRARRHGGCAGHACIRCSPPSPCSASRSAPGASGALNMWYDADIDARHEPHAPTRPIPRGPGRAGRGARLRPRARGFSVAVLGFWRNWLAAGLLALHHRLLRRRLHDVAEAARRRRTSSSAARPAPCRR